MPYFIYQQRIGAIQFWSYATRLTQQANKVVVEDIVFYAIFLGLLTRLCHQWITADKLTNIFNILRDYLVESWDNIH